LVVPEALAGNDVLAKSPTGSGKTLAFGVPLVKRAERGGAPAALVLVPTRELAQRVAEDLESIAGAKGVGPKYTIRQSEPTNWDPRVIEPTVRRPPAALHPDG
jgi:superfamily II DNA/RNA helicase